MIFSIGFRAESQERFGDRGTFENFFLAADAGEALLKLSQSQDASADKEIIFPRSVALFESSESSSQICAALIAKLVSTRFQDVARLNLQSLVEIASLDYLICLDENPSSCIGLIRTGLIHGGLFFYLRLLDSLVLDALLALGDDTRLPSVAHPPHVVCLTRQTVWVNSTAAPYWPADTEAERRRVGESNVCVSAAERRLGLFSDQRGCEILREKGLLIFSE